MCSATPATTAKITATLDCLTERAAAQVLGYDQASWGDPSSSTKQWGSLSSEEKEAATVLGYTEKSWNDPKEGKPASANKKWAELATTCGKCPDTSAGVHSSVSANHGRVY